MYKRQAEILLVGEGPGQHEDEQGIPFVGKAGMLLDDMLEIIGLDRTKVYVANIVKCRPPGNRDPLNVEQDACKMCIRDSSAAASHRNAPQDWNPATTAIRHSSRHSTRRSI